MSHSILFAHVYINIYEHLQKVLPFVNGNFIISPLSVQTALTLLWLGATGQTATKLQAGLKLGTSSNTVVGNEFNTLLRQLQNGTAVELANAIYVMKGYQIQPNYKSIVTKQFYSVIQPLNFANNVQSADTINSWVSQKTHDKITNLISADMLDSLTRLVLVNAIYFNGTWVNRFTSVNNGPFYSNGCDKSAVDKQMMHVSVSQINFNI